MWVNVETIKDLKQHLRGWNCAFAYDHFYLVGDLFICRHCFKERENRKHLLFFGTNKHGINISFDLEMNLDMTEVFCELCNRVINEQDNE